MTQPKADAKEDVQILGSEQTARLLDISGAFLRRMTQEGKIPKRAKGKYGLVEAVHAYIRFLRDENARSTKTAASSRMQDAKTAEIELRLAEKQRTVVPLDDATYAMEFAAAKFRDALMSLPARYTRDMAERRKLEALVNEELANVAAAFASARRYIRGGGADLHASTDDDA